MHTENTTFHLSRGSHTLTVTTLNGRFVGLIDGCPYIAAASPDAVVRHLVQASSATPGGVVS